eukprot:TRINITY_DN10360_c0_g1_i1.p1 TRINITY_DN10360_c0_g1~~TRINITY_DN10360_c0_g1_i1.p1  ORF type:complete len:248 (+),score=50.86 TRINITY_DN10360_c0_g1_i1:87-830(+)
MTSIQGVKLSQTARKAGVSVLANKSKSGKGRSFAAEESQRSSSRPSSANQTRAAPRENPLAVSFDLCVDTLMSGCVTSFVEFFELSHREPVCVDQLANRMFSIPTEKLPEIQGTLVQAEKARRVGEFREVYDCFIKLANYFEDEKDFATSLHFQQMGLDNAKQSSDKDLEGIAQENFGHAHERRGNIDLAIGYHETHLRLAEASRNQAMKRQAYRNLQGRPWLTIVAVGVFMLSLLRWYAVVGALLH